MRILGIDPGYAIVGFGVLDYEGYKFTPVHFGSITTEAHNYFNVRLKTIFDDMNTVLTTFKPDVMSIENNRPTFISCKIGSVDQMALYELETVANRFGGKYAKKVLATAQPLSAAHMQRAKEMGIEVRVATEF